MGKSIFRHIVVVVSICMMPYGANASWLSDITGVDINVPKDTITFGPPRPDRIPMMLQNLPKDTTTFFLNPAGNALAFAIRQAKDSARPKCIPIPAQVTTTLAPFFPNDLFAGVCWAVVGNGSTLDSFAIHDAGMAAITLEDVVIFRNSQDGYDPVLWSHELTHVLQYRRLGVEGFAALYTVAWDALEQQARGFDQFVARALQSANARQQYWITQNGWNPTQQITYQQYVNYSRQSVSPLNCARLQYVPRVFRSTTFEDVEIINNCPIPVQITAFQIHGLNVDGSFNGYQREQSCSSVSSECTIGPGQSKRFDGAGQLYRLTATMTW